MPNQDTSQDFDALRATQLSAALLQLQLDDAALQRVALQWQRLQAMAKALQHEPLGPGDEPAPTKLP